MSKRILIVGAGPTGLTTAVELARRGIEVDVVDKRDHGSGLSRAVGIMPASLELLRESGVSDRLLAEGIKVRAIQIFSQQTLALRLPLASAKAPTDFILGLPQDRTEHHLAAALQSYGGQVRYSTELTDLQQNASAVTATFGNNDTQEYAYAVGADGHNSIVRKKAGIEFPGFDLPEIWSIADVEAENWPHWECFNLFLGKRPNMIAVVPLAEGRYRLISNTPDAEEALPVAMQVTTVRRKGTFNIAIRQAEHYQNGRIFIAGDAAHCHSPVGGRGMNIGIADAAELARRFAKDDLVGYTASRLAEARRLIGGTESTRKVVSSRSPITRGLLLAALKLVSVLPPLKRRAALRVMYG